MRLLAPALLLAALLSGCAGDEMPDEPVPAAALPPLRFQAEVAPPQQVGGAEPNLAVLPDGTLFLTVPVGGSGSPNHERGAAYLWRSRDAGATWQQLRGPESLTPEEGPQATPFCSCDADVAASPDGWVYYSDWWIAGAAPGNYLVEASADGGETWTANSIPIPQNLAASMDRQWLVAGPDGFVALYYSFFGPTPVGSLPAPLPAPAFGLERGGQAIEAVFSNDHGASWSDPVQVVPPRQGIAYQIGHPRLGADGNVWMPYGAVESTDTFWRDPSEVRVSIVTKAGAPVDDVLVADAPQGFDNLWAVQGAQDPDTGRAYVVWSARKDDAHAAVHAAWSDDLRAWSPTQALDDTGINVLPWADARRGNVTFGWYGTETTGDPTDATADGAVWHAMAVEWNVDDAGNRTPVQVSTTPVKEGPLCPRGASCSGDRELLDYVSMAYAPDGRLHYAFARSEGNDAFVRVATALPRTMDTHLH